MILRTSLRGTLSRASSKPTSPALRQSLRRPRVQIAEACNRVVAFVRLGVHLKSVTGETKHAGRVRYSGRAGVSPGESDADPIPSAGRRDAVRLRRGRSR